MVLKVITVQQYQLHHVCPLISISMVHRLCPPMASKVKNVQPQGHPLKTHFSSSSAQKRSISHASRRRPWRCVAICLPSKNQKKQLATEITFRYKRFIAVFYSWLNLVQAAPINAMVVVCRRSRASEHRKNAPAFSWTSNLDRKVVLPKCGILNRGLMGSSVTT